MCDNNNMIKLSREDATAVLKNVARLSDHADEVVEVLFNASNEASPKPKPPVRKPRKKSPAQPRVPPQPLFPDECGHL